MIAICEGEIKTFAKFLRDAADEMECNYTDDIPICEICLIRIETIAKLLRQFKDKEKAPID